MKLLILANDFTYKYFNGAEDGIEYCHQLPIYWNMEYEGTTIDCKALLDVVYIDHNNKTIEPIDLKSIGKSVNEFDKSFLQFGYYRQAAWYTLAIAAWVKHERPYLSDYVIKPFKFIVVESKINSYNPAIIYQCSHHDIHVGMYGGYDKYDTKWPGVYELLSSYLWHEETNKWNMAKDLYDNKGVRKLDVFKKHEENNS